MKVAIVTGSSSGIGRATSDLFRKNGWHVIGFSRREGVDVTDDQAVDAAIRRILQDYGRIDVLVNNAGVGTLGASEFLPEVDLRKQLEVNFIAVVRLTQKILPAMRSQGFGRIINIASAAVMFPLPFQSVYSATKAAVFAWSRALSGEIERFGIGVTVVCPGDIRTGFTEARTFSPLGDVVYSGSVARALEKAAASEKGGGMPEFIARKIFSCAVASRPPLVVVPGWKYRLLDVFSRILPRGLVSKLVARLYV